MLSFIYVSTWCWNRPKKMVGFLYVAFRILRQIESDKIHKNSIAPNVIKFFEALQVAHANKQGENKEYRKERFPSRTETKNYKVRRFIMNRQITFSVWERHLQTKINQSELVNRARA